MSLEFGTDGIRGVANEELTAELSLALGRAAASVFGGDSTFLIGRDTRISGPMIHAALAAGLSASGTEVIDLGVLPTPAVAFLSAIRSMPAAVISASHNPFTDNGIKFFASGGRKLDDATELAIGKALAEALRPATLLASPGASTPATPPTSFPTERRSVGDIRLDGAGVEEYVEHLCSTVATPLQGTRVVIDCANGAASVVAPKVLSALGVDVEVINASPDGFNINVDCGSTHPEALQHAVVERGAQIGLAFDGDADRVLAVDERGNLVDGDAIIAMLALDAAAQGELKDHTIVVTVMSNLGLRLAMERNGIHVHETKVGDRYVLEALNEHGWSLGGEQSGHVILPALATTGDGILTGIQLIDLLRRDGRSFGDIAASSMTKLPQVLRNVRVKSRSALESAESVWRAVHEEEQKLGNEGRVLLRASGTEPLVRVMVEAPTQSIADEVCDRLCRFVERELK